VLAITCTVNPTLYFNVNWLPTYFNQERGMAAGSSEMRWILTLIYLGLDLGYLAFGFAAMRVPRIILFTLATVLVSVAALVPWAGDRSHMVALLVVSNFGIGMCMSMFLTLTQEVSKTAVSTAMGLLGGMGSLAGAILMWLVGVVTQRTHSFTGPFVAIAGAMVIAWIASVAATRLKATEA
jgi:cyanate permease